MFEVYSINGKTYQIYPNDRERFLRANPKAVLVDTDQTYIVNNKKYKISLDQRNKFLKSNPGAKLVTEQQFVDNQPDNINFADGIYNTGVNFFNERKKQLTDFQISLASLTKEVIGEDAGSWILGDDLASRGSKALVNPDNGNEVVFNQEAFDKNSYDADENQEYYNLLSRKRNGENINFIYTGTGEKVEDAYENAMQAKLDQSFGYSNNILRVTDKNVGGFTSALKKGQVDDMSVLALGFLANTAVDAGLAYFTRGTSMAGQMYGAGYTVYNDEKAKSIYGADDPNAFAKLLASGKDEIAVPGVLAAVGFGLEKIGYKGMTKAIMAKTGNKKAISLLIGGLTEGGTEYFQGLTERLNKDLGQGMNPEEAAKDVANYMFTEEAWDQFFAGLIGGTGLSSGGIAVNATLQGAFRSDPRSSVYISKAIDRIAALNEAKSKSVNSESTLKKLDEMIEQEALELKKYIESNKKVSDYLNEDEKGGIIGLVNNRRDISNDLRLLQKAFSKGAISEAEFDLKSKSIIDNIKIIDNDIKTIKTSANMRLLNADLNSTKDFVESVTGLEQIIYGTDAEFMTALKAEYEALGMEMPASLFHSDIHGTKIGNKILINAVVAAEENAVATSTHEVLHAILKSTLQGKDGTGHLSADGVAIVKSFIGQLSSKELSMIEVLLKNGNYKTNEDKSEKEFKEYGEEYLNMYAQLSKEGQFTKNNIQKFGAWMANFFREKSEFKKISFEDGNSTKAFLDAFIKGDKTALKGAKSLAQAGVDMQDNVVLFSKKSKEEIGSDSERTALITTLNDMQQGATTKAEFQNPRVFNAVYRAWEKGGAINNYVKSLNLNSEKTKEVLKELYNRILNFDPAALRKDGTAVGPRSLGERIMSDVNYSKLVANKNLFKKSQYDKAHTSTESEEAKNIVDPSESSTTGKSDVKDVKLRDLKDFDVYLDDGFGDALAIAEVNGILDKYQNGEISLKEAKSLMNDVTLKDIRAALSESIPKIAQDPIDGKTKPTSEYESWIRSEYNEIVQSLGIRAIRKYPWFKATITGKKDYKNVTEGNVSNYVKPTQINETNKRELFRWFLEGKPGDLRERRTALIRRIAERKASIAVDNKINSDLVQLQIKLKEGTISKAEFDLKSKTITSASVLSSTARLTKDEMASFDSVKYSMSMKKGNVGLKADMVRQAGGITSSIPFTDDKATFMSRVPELADFLGNTDIFATDKDAIKTALKYVYSDTPGIIQRVDSISDSIFSVLNDGKKLPKNASIEKTKEWIASKIYENNDKANTKLATYFNATRTQRDLQDDINAVKKARDYTRIYAIERFNGLNELFPNDPELAAALWYAEIAMVEKHSTSSARISDGKFIPDPDNTISIIDNPDYAESQAIKKAENDAKIVAIKKQNIELARLGKPLKKVPNENSSLRYGGQVWDSVQDFRTNIQGLIKGKDGKPAFKTEGQSPKTKVFFNGKDISDRVDFNTHAQTSAAVIRDSKNPDSMKKREDQVNQIRESLNHYVKWHVDKWKAGVLDNSDLMMVAGSLISNMNTMVASAAMPGWVTPDVNTTKETLVYEHMQPRVGLVVRLFDAHINGDGVPNTKEFFKNYQVAIIPESMDKALKAAKVNESLAPGQTHDDPPYFRYYFSGTSGSDKMRYLIGIGPNALKTAGESWVKGNNLIKPEIKKQKINSKAIQYSRTVNRPKGISVFDLDDTLATTKSGVRYTLPNPNGLPQPKKKVIFMAGGPGSGKSNVIKQLGLKEQGFKVVNQDISLEWLMKNHGMPTDMREFTPEQASEFGKLSAQAREIALKKRIKYQGEGDGVIIDGTGASLNVMKKNIQDFKDKGYDVQMIFVETSQETALSRNKARKERSLRTGIVIKTNDSVQANKEAYKELFGERFAEVNTDNLKQGDVMPADVVNKVNDFTSGYIKGRLNAGEYATKGEELKQQGAEFDFSEFNQIVEGKTAPLFNKAMKLQEKFTSKDMFVLTARPAESTQAIFEFLQANGLNIPIENVVGLGSSASSDKALWMAEKVGEGYNDFYFADDILENVQAVSDMLAQFDVKSKVQQAKRDFVLGDPKVTRLLDEQSMNDVKNTDRLANPGVYSNIKFSKSYRAEYENTVAKNRPDLSGKEVTATIDKMFEYIDGLDVPNKRKYEQITTKWLATSNIKLPEDSYKIQQAVEIAELKNEDIFSYKNPNEIIEKYAGTIKVKPISPDGIKEFTRSTGFNDPITKYGIVEYEVDDTQEGQQKLRDIVNTHWGPNSNPWCITQIGEDGNLTDDSWRMWQTYRKESKKIVFQNGKLLATRADFQYWDRMDKSTEGPIIQVKESRVTHRTELINEGGKIDPVIRETRTVSIDGNTVTTNIFENSKDGYDEGTTLVENRINGVTTKITRFDPDGSKVDVQEFNKKGKPITSYQFNPNGTVKGINGHLQRQALVEAGLDPDAAIEDVTLLRVSDELVAKVGDIVENNYTEKDVETGVVTDYFYGRVLVGDQVMEIGFESKTGLDLVNFTKTVDGKTRLDIAKILKEVDSDVKGLPKGGPKFSMGINKKFNDIIEQSTGVGSEKVFSNAQARIRGNKTRFDNIVPYSVQDLMGLLYNFMGEGKAGEQHMEFFKKALIDPFARGVNELNESKQSSAEDYSNLTKEFPYIKSILNKSIDSLDFTYDQAIRVYLWNKAGFEVPGLSKRDLNALDSIVKNNPELQTFAGILSLISKKEEGYAKPGEYWLVENIASDLLSDGSIGDARSEFLAEWQQNADEMFSKENLNKIQAIYGNKFREALEDILYRMKHGTNRPTGSSRLTNNFMNWINNSTGAIMFFNMRSALLQTLSTTNYINWTDNNPLKAAMAFANQKQYWSDFSALFNSDFLKQRRSGNQRSVNEAELTAAVANSDNKAKAAIAWLLQKGFLPTQIMDSFAISAGGATFYRNRINKYIKEGVTKEEAQEKAFLDFQEVTEATQQSARPDMISQQQASPLGRLILSFQNTPMQYARIMNKAARDIVNGRGDQKSNISKIVYYGALQSIIFAALQSAIFAALGDDEEEEFDKKKQRIVDSMVDGWLAGLGVAGKAIGTIERSIKEYLKQKERGFNADHAQTIIQLLGFSPPIGSKVRKIYGAIQTEQFNKGVSERRGLTLDNPTWSSWGNVIEGFTNIPLGRIANKMLNIDNALDSQNQWWERAALLLGWNTWDLGVKDPDIEAARGEVKEEKKQEVKDKNISKERGNLELQKREKRSGQKDIKCAGVSTSGERCKKKIEGGGTYCTIHDKAPQNASGKKNQCKKRKEDGKRCGMNTANKSGYCYYHD